MIEQTPQLQRALAGSALVITLERARLTIAGAAQRSRAAAIYRRHHGQWSAMAAPRRRLAAGIILLVASAVHVALNLLTGDSAGWFWLIIPGLAAVAGLLSLIMGVPPRR
jgi:hypothetical protein